MTQIHTMFLELERWLRRKDIEKILSSEMLGSVRVEGHKLKGVMKEAFDAYC